MRDLLKWRFESAVLTWKKRVLLIEVYHWQYLDIIDHCDGCISSTIVFGICVINLEAEYFRLLTQYAFAHTLCGHEDALKFLKFDSFATLWKTVYKL